MIEGSSEFKPYPNTIPYRISCSLKRDFDVRMDPARLNLLTDNLVKHSMIPVWECHNFRMVYIVVNSC